MLLEVLLLEVLLLELVEPLPVVCPGAPWDVPLLWLLGPGCARAAVRSASKRWNGCLGSVTPPA